MDDIVATKVCRHFAEVCVDILRKFVSTFCSCCIIWTYCRGVKIEHQLHRYKEMEGVVRRAWSAVCICSSVGGWCCQPNDYWL